MVDPVPGVRLAVECCFLDVYVLIGWVKVEVSNSGRLARHRASDVDAFKKRWDNQVHILTGVREEAHHAEREEGPHCAAIVVARQARRRGREEPGNVEV